MSRLANLTLVLCLLPGCSSTGAPSQTTFATPDEAVTALVEACRTNDRATLLAIFGADHEELVDTGDPAADRQSRMAFVERADEHIELQSAEDRKEIVIGTDAWPLPIPLVREGGRWRFDTEEGMEEILNRRIGRNELDAIELCRGYVDAQYIYRNRDWNGDGNRVYARRIKSNPGAFDGLYWPTDDPTVIPLCPLNDLITSNQDYVENREEGTPWRGYYVRVLERQGEHAEGGAMSYVVDGQMTAGFALIAWPARHDETGVMTFIVSHHGVVYQKDLGAETTALAAKIDSFDPDDTWEVVDG